MQLQFTQGPSNFKNVRGKTSRALSNVFPLFEKISYFHQYFYIFSDDFLLACAIISYIFYIMSIVP